MIPHKKSCFALALLSSLGGTVLAGNAKLPKSEAKRPNILFAIADDQSYPYASAYGTKGVHTPAFDEVARNGVLFTNAFVAAPQCSPSRAAILTGKNIWQLEEAGTHSSYFPKKYEVFTTLLENSGYQIGFTGKPWAPGNFKDAGWNRNPVGPEYNTKMFESVPTTGISKIDYFENFKQFYAQKGDQSPFFFWYGAHEPHLVYEAGSGKRSGKSYAEALVPSFLPDVELVRNDLLDFSLEIEWFDKQLAKMIQFLREKGELENTIIVVTADNGMPFPSSKANLREYGIHVPLAICWPAKIPKSVVLSELVGLIDLAPTFLEIAQIHKTPAMTGKSLAPLLLGQSTGKSNPPNRFILTGRERHSHARPDNLGYPARAIRTDTYLYILNLKPDRWPAGDPVKDNGTGGMADDEKSIWPGYHDIDNSPTKLLLIHERANYPAFFSLGYEKRQAEELYNIRQDPGCIHNLAEDPRMGSIKTGLRKILEEELLQQGDPRMTGKGDIFDSYPRFGAMRNFPGFKEKGQYNPKYQ